VPSTDANTYGYGPGPREQMSLLSVLRRRALIIIATTILCGGAAAAFAYLYNDTYESTSKLTFRQTIGTELNAAGFLPNTPDADNLAADNVEFVDSRSVAVATSRQLARRGVDMSVDDIESDVTVSKEKDTDVVDIVAKADSAERAGLLADVYANQAARLYHETQQELAERALRGAEQAVAELQGRERLFSAPRLRDHVARLRILVNDSTANPQITQPGFVPTSRSGNPVQTILLGVLFGVVLGVGLALLREQADRRLHRAEDVSAAFDARVLTTVPRNRSLKKNVPWEDLPSEVAEAFRMLFVNLRYAPGQRARTVLVTSSRSREGKSTVAWYLASAAAAGGLSVALVEADMRRPSLAKRFDLEPEPGLAEALGGRVSVAAALQTAPLPSAGPPGNGRAHRLEVLVAGTPSSDSWVLMQSGVMDRVLEVLLQRHDLVVLDTPPIPYVADAVSLLRRVDGVVVTASVSSTKGPEAARLRDQLATFDARILGVVANGGSAVSGYAYAPSVQRGPGEDGRPATGASFEQPTRER
jgi:succinoglycan biosynthesis transport protein ExoP